MMNTKSLYSIVVLPLDGISHAYFTKYIRSLLCALVILFITTKLFAAVDTTQDRSNQQSIEEASDMFDFDRHKGVVYEATIPQIKSPPISMQQRHVDSANYNYKDKQAIDSQSQQQNNINAVQFLDDYFKDTDQDESVNDIIPATEKSLWPKAPATNEEPADHVQYTEDQIEMDPQKALDDLIEQLQQSIDTLNTPPNTSQISTETENTPAQDEQWHELDTDMSDDFSHIAIPMKSIGTRLQQNNIKAETNSSQTNDQQPSDNEQDSDDAAAENDLGKDQDSDATEAEDSVDNNQEQSNDNKDDQHQTDD